MTSAEYDDIRVFMTYVDGKRVDMSNMISWDVEDTMHKFTKRDIGRGVEYEGCTGIVLDVHNGTVQVDFGDYVLAVADDRCRPYLGLESDRKAKLREITPPAADTSLHRELIENRNKEISTLLIGSAKPDTLRQDLARTFGLAPDAPDEVLLAEATRASDFHKGKRRMYRGEVAMIRAQLNKERMERCTVDDRCGDLEHENRELRARLGELLVRLEVKS